MQATLLGLAIAIILALVAAIVAPLVVDWNHYRLPIEMEASRLTGLDIRVHGAIDARLLPSPLITLHDVDAAEPGKPPLLRAGTLNLELSLGPLLRGQVQASEVHLIGPQLDLSLDRAGAVVLPRMPGAFHPKALSISQFTVDDGRVTIADAAYGAPLVLNKVWFKGDIASLAGPFNGAGAAVVGDDLYGFRLSGGPADGGGSRISLGIDPADRPLTTQFDGVLTFRNGVPQFDGSFSLARPVGATLANGERVLSDPWRAIGTMRASPTAAALENLALRYGPDERAVDFTGSADLTLGAHPRLTGRIAAMQVNIDRALADPDTTDRPPLVLLRSFLPAFAANGKLPMPAEIGVRVDSLVVGGRTIDSLSGALDFDGGGWSFSNIRFHAPGLTDIELSGRLTGGARDFAFSGPAAVSSADAAMLLKWVNGQGGDRAGNDAKIFSAKGTVTIARDRMAVAGLNAALNEEKIEGRLAYDWAADKRPARLDAELQAGELDLDALSTFAKSALGGNVAPPQQATLAIDIGKATYAGVAAQAVNAQLKFDAGKLQIDRLSIGDLAGAKLDISGRIDELSSQPRGQITLDLDASALDGLADIAAKLRPQDAVLLRRAADRLAPASMHAVLDLQQDAASGSTAALHLTGSMAALRVALNGTAQGQPAHLADAALRLDGSIDADDGTALLALLGLDHVLAVDQFPGRLTLSAAGPLNGELHVDGKVETSGFASTISGAIRLNGAQSPSGKLQVQAAAGDLRPLQQAMTGQTGIAVPVGGHAALAIAGDKFSFTDITATVGKCAVSGHVTLEWKDPIAIDGAVTADDIDADGLSALLLGLPSASPAPSPAWSSDPIGSGGFAALHGDVKFDFARAEFTPALVAGKLTGVAHFAPSALTVDNIAGTLAGGHIAGAIAFQRNGSDLGAHAKIDLNDVAAAAIIGPSLNVAGGQLTITLASDGFGMSPAALIASLHGSGTATLKDVRFAGLDAAAFAVARQAAGPSGPVDMAKVQAAVSAALANGYLTVPSGQAAFTIASGAINLNQLTLQADDRAQLSLNGAIDLGNAAINARMTLSETPPASALIGSRPELSLDIKGPLAAPRRTLDTSALTGWLTLSAAELQSRRIEMMEADRHGAAAAAASHPDAPDIRVMSPGTVVETAIAPQNPSAATPRIERLRPIVPPATPGQGRSGASGASGAGKSVLPATSAAAGAAE